MKRLWEIDAARGLAIIMMILSNFLFDLYFFGLCHNCYSGFWLYFARFVAFLFIFLAGVSLTLSYSRNKSTGKFMKRGVRILLYGMLVSVVTYAFIPNAFVIFGILHLIGLSIILGFFLVRFRITNLLLGIIIIVMGFLLESFSAEFPWLVWIGLKYNGFFSVDYTPLFPWFGVFLLGIFFGNAIYSGKKRLQDKSNLIVKTLSYLGRKSLFIYMVHQPILLGILFIIGVNIL